MLAGVVDGRNIWRTDAARAAADLERVAALTDRPGVSTSCSLLHVPVDLEAESDLPDALVERLSFARQKLREVVALAEAGAPRPGRPAAPATGATGPSGTGSPRSATTPTAASPTPSAKLRRSSCLRCRRPPSGRSRRPPRSAAHAPPTARA
ncbi:hypothetical protein GCM10029992_13240 [Glycomyces albus]